MTPVSHGKPCAGNPHARFEEGASASETPRRKALLHKCFKITALVLAAALASIAVGVQVLALFCLYVVAFRGETICPFYPEIDTRFAPGFSKAGFEKIECGMPENKVVDLIGSPLWIKPQADRTSHEEWGYSGDGALGCWGDKAWFYYGVVFDSGHVIEKHVRIYYD